MLEADRPGTRSNDGRADPHGGFWIGTMSKTAAEGEGAIYRYYRGEVRRLHPGITIPNSHWVDEAQLESVSTPTVRSHWLGGCREHPART